MKTLKNKINLDEIIPRVLLDPDEAYRLLSRKCKTRPKVLALRCVQLTGALSERYGFEKGGDIAIDFFNKVL